ncbi:MFS transporter [Desulfovibrio inopinatus]|uniref:MFS transporter n=1 Tax=Desulfovibrio inopinatus TaxID=102109 RepID=UPI0004897FF2|nr:MFS transporter [Desulfovibrio inopinatus]
MNQSIFLDIAESFSINTQHARFAFSIISLCYSVTFLFIGPIADTFDCRKITALGHAVISIVLMIVAGLHGYSWFLGCMGLIGIAAATVPASMFPYVSRLASTQQTEVYIGAIVASATLGIVVGRVALGAFTDVLGWRDSYRIFSLTFAFLSLFSLYILGTPPKGERSTRKMKQLYIEMAQMVITPATISLLLTGFFLFFGFLGTITFLTYRLAASPFFFNSAQVGYISFAGLAAIIAPFSGGLSKRFGPYKIIIPSLIICLTAMQLLYWSQNVFSMTLAIVLLFLGVYACQPLLFLLIGRRIRPQIMGCASSLYILFCIGGGSVASLILGGIWEKYGWAGIILTCSASITLALAIIGANTRREHSIR